MTDAPSMTTVVLTVSDLHQSEVLYKQLAVAVNRHRPVVVCVVGDCLDHGEDMTCKLSKTEYGTRLSQLRCADILFVRGNHDSEGWMEFANGWRRSGRPLQALNGEVYLLGSLAVVGFPCQLGDPFHFIEGQESRQLQGDNWLDQIIQRYGPAARALWLMHEPPLDEAVGLGWSEAMKRYAPRLVISGHTHDAPTLAGTWKRKIGRTLCVNVGQELNGPLHYTTIRLSSNGLTLTVTAYPWEETVTV